MTDRFPEVFKLCQKKNHQWKLDPELLSSLVLFIYLFEFGTWVWDLSQQHFCLFSSTGPWSFLTITTQRCAKTSDMRHWYFSRKKFQLVCSFTHVERLVSLYHIQYAKESVVCGVTLMLITSPCVSFMSSLGTVICSLTFRPSFLEVVEQQMCCKWHRNYICLIIYLLLTSKRHFFSRAFNIIVSFRNWVIYSTVRFSICVYCPSYCIMGVIYYSFSTISVAFLLFISKSHHFNGLGFSCFVPENSAQLWNISLCSHMFEHNPSTQIDSPVSTWESSINRLHVVYSLKERKSAFILWTECNLCDQDLSDIDCKLFYLASRCIFLMHIAG